MYTQKGITGVGYTNCGAAASARSPFDELRVSGSTGGEYVAEVVNQNTKRSVRRVTAELE